MNAYAPDKAATVVPFAPTPKGQQPEVVADEAGRFFRTPLGHPALELVTPDAAAPELPDLKPVLQALATPPHGEPDR